MQEIIRMLLKDSDSLVSICGTDYEGGYGIPAFRQVSFGSECHRKRGKASEDQSGQHHELFCPAEPIRPEDAVYRNKAGMGCG